MRWPSDTLEGRLEHRRFAAPVSESRSARSWTLRSGRRCAGSGSDRTDRPRIEASGERQGRPVRRARPRWLRPARRPRSSARPGSGEPRKGACQTGSEAGSRRLKRASRAAPRRAGRSGRVAAVVAPRPRPRREDKRAAVAGSQHHAAPEAEAEDHAVEDDPGLPTGSATSSSWAPSSTRDSRPARRCRSSRSLSAEKAESRARRARTTSRSGPASGRTRWPGRERCRPAARLSGLGVEDDEQEQRIPERDLQAGPVRREQRDADQMEEDEEAE